MALVHLASDGDDGLIRSFMQTIRGSGFTPRTFPRHGTVLSLGANCVQYTICSSDLAAHPNARTVENALILGD